MAWHARRNPSFKTRTPLPVWVTVLLVLVSVGAALAGVAGLVWLRWKHTGYRAVPTGDERTAATGSGWYGSGSASKRQSGGAGGSESDGGDQEGVGVVAAGEDGGGQRAVVELTSPTPNMAAASSSV